MMPSQQYNPRTMTTIDWAVAEIIATEAGGVVSVTHGFEAFAHVNLQSVVGSAAAPVVAAVVAAVAMLGRLFLCFLLFD